MGGAEATVSGLPLHVDCDAGRGSCLYSYTIMKLRAVAGGVLVSAGAVLATALGARVLRSPEAVPAKAIPADSPFVRRVLGDTSFAWRSVSRRGMRIHAPVGSHADARLDALADSSVAVRQEIARRLGLDASAPDGVAHVFLLADPEDFRGLVGQRAGGWTEPGSNAILAAAGAGAPPPLRHEFAHLLSHRRWGVPRTYWLSEGVAVFSVGHCAGHSLHDWANAAARDGDSLSIRSLVPFDFSRAAPHLIAGSFVQHVAERHGIGAVRAMWRHGLAAAEGATGMSADALEESWREELRTRRRTGTHHALDVAGIVRCETS